MSMSMEDLETSIRDCTKPFFHFPIKNDKQKPTALKKILHKNETLEQEKLEMKRKFQQDTIISKPL